MEYPSIIKGVWQSYAVAGDNPSDAEIPIEDIEKFTLSHETYRNGLQLRGYIKEELIDKFNSVYTDIIKKGKYKVSQKSFTIRAKDMPKFRRVLFKELQKTPTIVVRSGINAGTPIAMSYTFSKKELKVEAV